MCFITIAKSTRNYFETALGKGTKHFTWKAHIENKVKCVYIMQRFIIKYFSFLVNFYFWMIKKYFKLTLRFVLLSPLSNIKSGFHSGFLLSTILDRSTISLQKTSRRRAVVSRIRLRQKYLGAGYVLCKWETVVLSHSNNQQWVHSSASFWLNH